MVADARKIGLLKKSMYGRRDAASNWERDGTLIGKNLFPHKKKTVLVPHSKKPFTA